MAEDQIHVVEAIAADTTSLLSLFLSLQEHPKSSLLFLGILPQASMYVVESHRCISSLDPKIGDLLPKESVDFLQPFRHRAKLLDDSQKMVKEVADGLARIAEQHKQYFIESHKGFLSPLTRFIQPHLGFSTYDGHIFSTTHVTAFNFGEQHNLEELGLIAYNAGEKLGVYTAHLFSLFYDQSPLSLPKLTLSGNIEMRDIKANALYQRGSSGKTPMAFAAALTLLLSNLNYINYVLRPLLPIDGLTLFKLKFVVAFHANENLRAIQNRLASNSTTNTKALDVFRNALSNSDSKWLHKHSSLRNLLVHYLPDHSLTHALPSKATRKQVIEHFGGKLTYDEIDVLLDRHIECMSRAIEIGFDLYGNPFWYGRVT